MLEPSALTGCSTAKRNLSTTTVPAADQSLSTVIGAFACCGGVCTAIVRTRYSYVPSASGPATSYERPRTELSTDVQAPPSTRCSSS